MFELMYRLKKIERDSVYEHFESIGIMQLKIGNRIPN